MKKLFCNFLSVGLLVVLAGCSLPQQASVLPQERFADTHAAYLKLLRWREFPALAGFYTEPRRDGYLARVRGLEEFQVVDAELVRADFREATREMETDVEIKYYLLSSPTVRTMQLKQRWSYFPGDALSVGQWFITSQFEGFPGGSPPP